MRVSTVAILYGAQLATAAVTTMKACGHDNCLRAVIASSIPTRQGTADCSSYFATTVTPATVTITPAAATVTQTTVTIVSDAVSITETDTPAATAAIPQRPGDHDLEPYAPSLGYIRPTMVKQQMTVVPSSIPAYASACSGAVRYSSACSCVDVTGKTITAVAPTVTAVAPTVYVTVSTALPHVTTTVTTVTAGPTASTVVQCQPLPTFVIQAIVPGGPDDQLFAQTALSNDGDTYVSFNPTTQSQASRFSLNAQGNLVQDSELANVSIDLSYQLLYFSSPATITSFGYMEAVCSIDGAGSLTCNGNGNTVLQLCTGNLFIGPSLQSSCVQPTFMAIPVCSPPAPA